MENFETSKVTTEFRDCVTESAPIVGRKYTLTHSDTTGELFVTVGRTFADDKFNSIRDEVILEIKCMHGEILLRGMVKVDLPGNPKASGMRNEIFLKQMPLALKAIRYGDRAFYKAHPELDDAVIFICFCSESDMYSAVYDYGVMGDYKN